jgi:hypothetical protein
VRTRTEVVALDGSRHLDRVHWRDNRDGSLAERDIRHVFCMTGAAPCTSWLKGCIALDAQGFIKTGAGPHSRRSCRGALAAAARALSARDEQTWCVRGGRCSLREHQTGRVGGRRGVDRYRLDSQSARRVNTRSTKSFSVDTRVAFRLIRPRRKSYALLDLRQMPRPSAGGAVFTRSAVTLTAEVGV